MLSTNVWCNCLLDLRFHRHPGHIRKAHDYSRSKRSLLGTTSHWRLRLHRVWDSLHAGDAAKMVSTCSKGAGMAHRCLESDRRWSPQIPIRTPRTDACCLGNWFHAVRSSWVCCYKQRCCLSRQSRHLLGKLVFLDRQCNPVV